MSKTFPTLLGPVLRRDGDFILFESVPDESAPIRVYRLIQFDSRHIEVYLLRRGTWVFDKLMTYPKARARFKKCWDAYQRIIT